jgi:hypothetical protein
MFERNTYPSTIHFSTRFLIQKLQFGNGEVSRNVGIKFIKYLVKLYNSVET